MEQRNVKLSALLKLTLNRSPISKMGLLFTILSVFVIFSITIFITSSVKEPYEKYDFDAIAQNDTAMNAKVVALRNLNNVSINGAHPKVINYSYVVATKYLAKQKPTISLY